MVAITVMVSLESMVGNLVWKSTSWRPTSTSGEQPSTLDRNREDGKMATRKVMVVTAKEFWNYGVNGGNVNTKHPIDLNIGFPVDSNGNLKSIFIGLYQDGDTHPKATMTLNGGGMAEVGNAIRRGMLPGFSLWHVGETNWWDKPNCNYDYPSGSASFSNWQLVDNAAETHVMV